jgi:hypothetical protein
MYQTATQIAIQSTTDPKNKRGAGKKLTNMPLNSPYLIFPV